MSIDNTFPKSHHLLNKADFDFVFNKAKKVSSQYITILYRPNEKEYPRIGFILSKKNIKLAVNRNKVRRVIRESFRHHKDLLKGLDVVILGRKGLGQQENLRASIDQLWKKIKTL